ncbi:FCRLA protein, partial [Malurus elegans]|nr:FCRLA protein [Malurus elegans]
CPPDKLVLQVPTEELFEGDAVTLRCRTQGHKSVTGVPFYREDEEAGTPRDGTELSLSRLQLNHSGRYSCGGWLDSELSPRWEYSAPVIVTVH